MASWAVVLGPEKERAKWAGGGEAHVGKGERELGHGEVGRERGEVGFGPSEKERGFSIFQIWIWTKNLNGF